MKKVIISTVTAFTLLSSSFSASAQGINGNEVQMEHPIKSELALVNLPKKTTGSYREALQPLLIG